MAKLAVDRTTARGGKLRSCAWHAPQEGRKGSLIEHEVANGTGQLRQQIEALGPWFHNLRIHGEQTAPHHFLGDYPATKWQRVAPAVPEDLRGASVLDIGCNAGFYSIELKRRGAGRVLGIDADEDYLRQARFAADQLQMDIEFRKCSVYDVDTLHESFDIVLFMGLFYHLRYPLFALDRIVQRVQGVLVFQTLTRPNPEAPERCPVEDDYDFWQDSIFSEPGFPRMAFIEKSYAGDCTNWWVPNVPAVEAILRSAGLEIFCHPEPETWFCAPANVKRRDRYVQELEFAGQLW